MEILTTALLTAGAFVVVGVVEWRENRKLEQLRARHRAELAEFNAECDSILSQNKGGEE